jgi:uncharacterized repeat protein (TIGR02543 family)
MSLFSVKVMHQTMAMRNFRIFIIFLLSLVLTGLQGGQVARSAVACGSQAEFLSSPVFPIDIGNSYLANYIGYKVTPTSSVSNLWVKIGTMTGPVTLTAGQSNKIRMGAVTGGTSVNTFFHAKAPAADSATDSTHIVSLFDGDPDAGGSEICSSSNLFTEVADKIAANANKVDSIQVSSSGSGVGIQTATALVSGQTGTIAASGEWILSPAPFIDFPSDKWQLISTKLETNIVGGVPSRTLNNILYINSVPNSDEGDYKATFTFLSIATATSSTNLTPISYITSGGPLKFTGSLPTQGSISAEALPVTTASTYTVTYNANTASSGTVPTDSNTYANAATVTVLGNTGTLAKTGYTFGGWCTTQPVAGDSCTGTSQAVSSTFAMGSANVTLYAVWTANTLNVTFDTQGGTSISSTTTTTGASLSNPGTPTRAGYTFNGWFVASTGGSALTFAYAHGRTADFTLYAQWTLIAYSITYDQNFVGKPSDSVVSVNYGVDALLNKPTDPTRDGYSFAGWSETTNGSLITSFIVVGTKTFYAIWTPVPPAPIVPPVTITWPNPSNIQYTTLLSRTQLNATAMCNGIAVSGTYTYSPALGGMLEPGTYTLTVTFTPTSGSCSGASKTVQLVVEKQYPKITWKDAFPIVIGTPLTETQLNALFSVPGICVYTPALTTVLPVGTHTLSVTCTPTNGNLYFPVTTTVKIEVLPIEKSAVEPIVIPGKGSTTVPVPNGIQGSRSQVITLGPCLTSAAINGARITYTPAPGCSGKTYITISTIVNGITTITTIPITILVVASPSKTGPITFTEGKIWWAKSPNAKSYEVTIWGQVVCTTTDLTCNVTRTIGPKTPVIVIAKGNDGLTAASNAVYENKKPLIATSVYFDTAKFKIKPEGEAEIKRVAAIIKKEGFTRLIVEGHTDSKGGVDNQALSNNRSKATAAAFKKLLPAISTKIQGSAFRKPAADNDTPEGMALNRRSEVLVW